MKNKLYKILACGLFAAALAQTARADFLVLSNDFNNSSNNLAANNGGVGGGFTAFSLNNGVNQFAVDAYETNGKAYLASSVIGALSASLDSIDTFNINGGGTVFQLSGVNFSTNTPIANTGVGNNDRFMIGVGDRAPAGDWLSAGVPAGIPTGFWIQPMSDSLITGTGAGSWSGTSALFYKSRAGTVTRLASWTFDTLKWSQTGPNNFTPTLNIQLTLSGTGWALNITGDKATNQPISFSGTYAAAGISNELLDGITGAHFGGFIQCERPGISMSIDKAIVTQSGTLSVTTPTISSPWELQNTNVVLDGEPVTLTSIVTATGGTPTFQWQLEDSSAPGTFTNLPNGTATNVVFDTTGLGDSTPRGVRLVATMNVTNIVTSPVVKITTIPAVGPSLVRDTDPTSESIYAGLNITFSASFYGNQPMDFRWRKSTDGINFSYIANATNSTYSIASLSAGNNGYYLLEASNKLGMASSTASQLSVVAGSPFYHWNLPVPYGGLTSDQILTGFGANNKIAGAVFAKNGGNPILVTNGDASVISFASCTNSWVTITGATGFTTGANTNQTGNANFNSVLDAFAYDNGTHTITLNGLVAGQQYQVQLFGLDDRTGNAARRQNYADPADGGDTSATSRMGDNSYTLATFTASGTSQSIQQNLNDTVGNFNCLVLRSVGWNPPPYFTVQPPATAGFFSGNTAVFHSTAAGDTSLGAITYQWKSGPPGGPYTALAEGGKYTGTTTTDLTINSLVAADADVVYVLTASNTGGSQTSREVNLSIQTAPPLGTYGQNALALGPVALWMLNDSASPVTGAAQALDSSGNGHTASYGINAQNGSSFIVGPQPPTYPGFNADETALSTSGATDGSSIVTLPALNDTNLETSVALWIYPKDNGNFAKGFIGGRNNTGVGQIWQFGYSGGNGTLGYNWNDVGATYNYNSGLSPVQNTWNFVALVIQSNQATFYLYYISTNTGLPVLKSAVNPVANVTPISMASGTTVIGSDPYAIGGRTFNGMMAGVALYNKALSATDVQSLFGTAIGQTGGFPATIATQPPSVITNIVGHTIQISAVTSGTAPITNQWQFNGTNLTDGGQFSGTTSNVLTITGLTTNNNGIYTLTVTNGIGGTVSSNVSLTVLAPLAPPSGHLVGQWLSGVANLADQSGFSLAAQHTGYGVTGTGVVATNFVFTNDVPTGYAGQSLTFLGNTAIAISNSSTLDAAYDNTFDDGIASSFTVALWAKGFPGQWNPWVSKFGETTPTPAGGWQLRRFAGNNTTVFTARGTGATDDPQGSITSNDGQWHYYVGTYDAASGIRNLYVDGNLSISLSGNGAYTLSPATHLTLGGRDQPAGNNFTSYLGSGRQMFDVRIYNVALNLQQAAYIQQGPVPTFSSSVSGGKLVLSWSSGTLLESTNILGPWTTNSSTSPFTNSSLTDPSHYYRVRNP